MSIPGFEPGTKWFSDVHFVHSAMMAKSVIRQWVSVLLYVVPVRCEVWQRAVCPLCGVRRVVVRAVCIWAVCSGEFVQLSLDTGYSGVLQKICFRARVSCKCAPMPSAHVFRKFYPSHGVGSSRV